MGRLVKTHSTYIEGLIPILRELSKEKDLKTITPGRIYKLRGKSELFSIRITVETLSGYKLITKKGLSAQEVFIKTKLGKIELFNLIKKKIASSKSFKAKVLISQKE